MYPKLIETIIYYKSHIKPENLLIRYVLGDLYFMQWKDISLYIENPQRTSIDSIFPPYPESLFLSRLITDPFGTFKFLDVGVGSGMLSIVAAKRGWNVLGIDINRRAIISTYVNAKLNNVDIETELNDYKELTNRNEFQLCIANLPFEPTPKGCTNYIHSDGGYYGDEIIIPFLKIVPELLAEEGVAIVPTFSLLKEGVTRIEKKLNEHKDKSVDYLLIRLSKPIGLKLLFKKYEKKYFIESYKELEKEGYKKIIIELIIIKKRKSKRYKKVHYRGPYQETIADRKWLEPIE